MTPLDKVLYKTHKSVLEAQTELGDNNVSLITLSQCNSCGIWLKDSQLKPDLDGLPICKTCEDFYGL